MSQPTRRPIGDYAPPPATSELTVTSSGGARLHVEIHGPEDAPAVVLAHGWTCSTAYWALVIKALSANHRVIAYDQRGHGRSPALPGSYSTDALADDLCAVLDAALPDGRQAVVVGHSMGAMTVIAAADRPQLRQRAAAVLLCSTGPSQLLADARVLPIRSPGLRTRLQRALLGSSAPLGPVTPLAKWMLRYATMGPDSAPDEVEVCARIVHACPRRVRAEWAHVLATLDLAAQLPKLTAPTQVLAGTADRLTPMSHAHRMVEALPDCRGLIELGGRGHMTSVEAPDDVTVAIQRLVSAHLAGDGGASVPAARTAADATVEETS